MGGRIDNFPGISKGLLSEGGRDISSCYVLFNSDIDIMAEFDPAARVMVFNYAGLKDYIASLFDDPVDVVSREGLKPYVRPAVIPDAIYAF